MASNTAELAKGDLLMIEANLQIARLYPQGHRLHEEPLQLVGRILPRVPEAHRTCAWQEACRYLKKHIPDLVSVPCSA